MKAEVSKDKDKTKTPAHNCDIKCFRYLVGVTLHLNVQTRKNDNLSEWEGKDWRWESEYEEIPPLEEASVEDFVAYVVEGETLVLRCGQIKDDDMEEKREIIFHTKCHVRNKDCNMIIDKGVGVI